MTCKDCVHYEVCAIIPIWRNVEQTEDNCCRHFKPKSRFVELPCDFCKIIVTGTAENPYYQLLYYQNRTNSWHIGYSSYDLANVFRWKQELEEAEKALSERSK